MRASGCEIPEWMLQMKNPNKYVIDELYFDCIYTVSIVNQINNLKY